MLLDAARAGGVQRFCRSPPTRSTARWAPGLLHGDVAPKPSSPYSASKAAADLLALAYRHTFGLDVVVTRRSDNYGPYQFPEKLIPLMIINALEDQPLPVYGDGCRSATGFTSEITAARIEAVLRPRARPARCTTSACKNERPTSTW